MPFFSEHFGVDPQVIEDFGALDVSLIVDLPLFIDPFLLFNSANPEYRRLHDELIRIARTAATDSLIKQARAERQASPPRVIELSQCIHAVPGYLVLKSTFIAAMASCTVVINCAGKM